MSESRPSTPGASPLPQPSRAYRWAVLIFISLAMFGNYYLYDTIAPIADLLKSQLNFTDQQIGLLYSVYSWAAVIILLLGGVVIDRIGTKKSTLIFGAICFFAGLVTAISPNFLVMATGRFMLGLGAEPLIVAITTALAKWFKGKELSFALAINLTVARLASVAADNSPRWASASYTNWQSPLWIGTVIGSMCIIGAIIYWILESRAEGRYDLGEAGQSDKLEFRGMWKFNKSYWYIVGLCVTFYSAVFPFRGFAIKLFQDVHHMTRADAGALNSILPFSAMIASPLFGLWVDKVGKRALFMAFGSLLLLPVYLMVVYLPTQPILHINLPFIAPIGAPLSVIIAVIALGIAFSLIPAIMWPSVAYIVEQNRLGTGYALMTLIQQIGVSIMVWAVGKANDVTGAGAANPDGYRMGMWILSVLGLLGLVFSYLLRRAETSEGAHGLETITAGGKT
ncbi:MAG TPA: MFS transporter [Terriglobales bacterium]|nr:MFS transporter [Terriglobales bacterium]